MPALHHDYRIALSAWQQRPANDNAQITADSFTDFAARRAFVQREQCNPDPVLALPQLERLGRTSPDVGRLWKYWRDLQTAPAPDVYNAPEIVRDLATTGALRPENGIEEGAEPLNTGFSEGGEQDLEIRPTVAEIERAIEGAGRVSVTCMVRNGKRFDVRQVRRPLELGSNARIGDLVFRNGKMVQWGKTERGVALAPIEQLRASKGSRKKRPSRDLRFLVRTDAPIARNAGFMAGATASTGHSGAPLELFAEAQLDRKAEDRNLRAALGAHAEILDMGISDATAREIGERRGYHGKTAERRGIFLINEAFAALRALVGEPIALRANLLGVPSTEQAHRPFLQAIDCLANTSGRNQQVKPL